MTPVDRFQALIRHPDYIRDAKLPCLKILKNGILSYMFARSNKNVSEKPGGDAIEGYAVLRSWGLNYAVDPEDPKETAEA